MTEADWRMMVAISEERSISRAAERLYISQPALSYRLRMLEEEFRARLFFRTPGGVTLTPQGESVLAYARDMILSLAKMKERLSGMSGGVRGPLRIGSSAVFANFEMPGLLGGFLERYPDVEIFLKTGVSRQIARMMEREEVSVAIMRGDYPWTETRHRLREEPICLVSRLPVALEDLPALPRIMYGTDTSLQQMVDEWWRQTYFKPSFISMEVDSMDTCRRMVLQGLGWAILPEIVLGDLGNVMKRQLYWPDGSPLVRRTWILCRNYAMQLPAVRAFVEYITASCAPWDERCDTSAGPVA